MLYISKDCLGFMALPYKINCGDLVKWRFCTNGDIHYTLPATW